MMDTIELKNLLDPLVEKYNQPAFIQSDPIQIPHLFSKKEDIEIIGFLTAIISWGNRQAIIKNANKITKIMHDEPHQFILNYDGHQPQFVHRTFNATDFDFFLRALQHIYTNRGGLEQVLNLEFGAKTAIMNLRNTFQEVAFQDRSLKHLANPEKGSSAKRINMFLRWMVRKDGKGVDFGLWNSIHMKKLMVPLDVHTGNSARALNLVSRNANDWKSLDELMEKLRQLDPADPAKYDFALFGISVDEKLDRLQIK